MFTLDKTGTSTATLSWIADVPSSGYFASSAFGGTDTSITVGADSFTVISETATVGNDKYNLPGIPGTFPAAIPALFADYGNATGPATGDEVLFVNNPSFILFYVPRSSSGTISGDAALVFGGTGSGDLAPYVGTTYDLGSGVGPGETYTLSVTSSIPEPSSAALLGLWGFGLVMRRRR